MSNSRRQILKCLAALLGCLACLGPATPAIAGSIAVYLKSTVTWVSDFPFVPSTVLAGQEIYTDARGSIYGNIYENVNPLAGPLDLSPSQAIFLDPGETILWWFGGSLTSGNSSYAFCAYGDFALPSQQCNQRIPIATIMSDDFGDFFVTGAVFAFGNTVQDTVQIGTWSISSHQDLVPEPASLALMVAGLAGLGFSRRRR